VGPEKGRISNVECAVIGQIMARKRAVCLKPGTPDGRRAKLLSQSASLC
jgi:hypothetical protein